MKQCISEIECKIASIKYDIAKNKQKFEIFKKNDTMVQRKYYICTKPLPEPSKNTCCCRIEFPES